MSHDDSGDCFYNVVSPIISKLKISLGNHDTPEDGSASLQNEYESYFKLKKPFYSFDYKNTHFIMMDSTHETHHLINNINLLNKIWKKYQRIPILIGLL